MQGFVLFDAEGRRLTRNLSWSKMSHAGWLWTTEEANAVLILARYWQYKPPPSWCQLCELVWTQDHSDNYIKPLEEAQKL